MAEATVQEALRLHPPVVDMVREVAAPATLDNPRVAAGTVLMAVRPLVHRRRDLYDEPDRFRPQRFVDERPDPSGWNPFGGGRRHCLGAALALIELTALVEAVAAAGRLRPARAAPERPRLSGTTLVPARGGEVVLERA